MSKVNSGPEKAAMESPKNLQVSKTVETVTKTFHNSTEIVWKKKMVLQQQFKERWFVVTETIEWTFQSSKYFIIVFLL